MTRRAKDSPDAIPLDRTLTHRLHTLHKLSDRVSQSAYLKVAGIPMSEGRCLAAIGAFEPLSVNDLAHRANLNKGQASRAAQTLVDQGLVRKVANDDDARGVLLRLSASGRKRWKSVMELIERRNDEIFGCLTLPKRALLGEILDRLIAEARRDCAHLDESPDP